MAPSQKRRKNMERELFYEKMKEALMELKPDEMEITFMRVDKQNRMGLHGCTLSMPDAAAAPTFYLEGNCSEPPVYCRTISAFPAKAAAKAS